jgi:hypothetical protein
VTRRQRIALAVAASPIGWCAGLVAVKGAVFVGACLLALAGEL